MQEEEYKRQRNYYGITRTDNSRTTRILPEFRKLKAWLKICFLFYQKHGDVLLAVGGDKS